jgi:hypothetical protein
MVYFTLIEVFTNFFEYRISIRVDASVPNHVKGL